MNTPFEIGGVWSAVPTPFTDDWKLDKKSIARLVEHQLKLGVRGIFIGGTSGEGPWLTQMMLKDLVKYTVRAVRGRVPIAVQVTDNSSMRMIDNVNRIADIGTDIIVIAPPFFQMNPTQDYLRKLYLEVIDKSPLPVGLYHRGKHSAVVLSGETIAQIAEHEKVIMIKDSSADEESKTIFLRLKNRPSGKKLSLLNGNEFDCITYLNEGYDGLLLGGACFNGGMAQQIYELVRAGNLECAKEIQERMNTLMYEVFGGKKITCWLAGQKQMLVELGIFSTCNTIINYQVSTESEATIKKAFQQYKSELLPY